MTVTESPGNAWRQATPGAAGWQRSARPDDPDKLYLASADCHAQEPSTYLAEHIERQYLDRIPRLERHDDGSEWIITEGNRPQLVKRGAAAPTVQAQQSFERPEHVRHAPDRMEPEDVRRNTSGLTIEQRLADQAADGVDVELIFPNKGLLCWATPDPVFADAMCRAWNRWADDWFGGAGGWNDGRTRPLACIATGDIDLAMAAATWAAEHGFVGLCLGNSPIYGPKEWGRLEYNDPRFEPFWALTEELGLPLTFHVSTGRDPRAVGGNGGAVINYVCHSMETTIEPLVQLITSGVFERHPGLQAGLVESGIGFVPWLLETMDYAYRAHHMWVRPVIPELPSTYFRQHCFATFQEDHVGLDGAERYGLVGNLMWANDYPHHEGSWPHSAASIERQMSGLAEDSRAQILGLNAKRVFALWMRGAAVVAGVGESTYYDRGAAPETEFQLACIAIRNAVADAGLALADVDGFVAYMERNEPVRLSAALGVGDVNFTAQTFGGGGNGAGAAVTIADAAISAGYAECIVVFRSLAQGQFGRYGQAAGSRRAGGHAAFTAPYGLLTPAQTTALQTMRYMHDHGVSQDSLAEISLTSYAHAQHNPRAIRYGTPLTPEQYHASRWIAEPFHLYDCCPENDGAAAIVVTSAERARDLAKAPVAIVAGAHGLEHRDGVGAFGEANFPTAHHRHVGRTLWQRAGVTPDDVRVAQFYENFTGPVLMAIAEMGFCEPSELDGFVAGGNLRWPDGRLPINTSGGNIGEAYIHGFGNVVEAVRQVRGESTCQVADVELSLSVSGPGYAPGSAVLFGRV